MMTNVTAPCCSEAADNLVASASLAIIPGGSSFTLYIAAVLACFVVGLSAKKSRVSSKRKGRQMNLPPGPPPLPFLGSLHHLGGHDIPFAGFSELRKSHGDVYSVRMGSTDCVVVNSTETRDEVLISRANDFDGRPDFERFRILFGGDKQNGRKSLLSFSAFTMAV